MSGLGRRFTSEYQPPVRSRPRSPECRAKISAALKGNQHAKGWKRPPESRAAISLRLLGNKSKTGRKDSADTLARKRGSMLAKRDDIPVIPTTDGRRGYGYRDGYVVFYRPEAV